MALMANEEVLAVPVKDVDACYSNAHNFYDKLISKGCRPHDLLVNCHPPPRLPGKSRCKDCKKNPTTVMDNLITTLQNCGRTDHVTLCRVIPGGVFTNCQSLTSGMALTQEECEKLGKEDFNSNDGYGSITTFKAADSTCVDAIKYDCSQLC